MLKRLLIVLPLTMIFVLAVDRFQVVEGVLLTESERAMLDARDTAASEDTAVSANRGNTLMRALKAPFKAIGRLFGFGKKSDDRLQRLSEKDIKNFKSTPADPVRNAATPPAQSAQAAQTPLLPSSATVTDHLARGRELLNQGNLDEAIAELSTAALLDAKSGAAHNLLGVAYEQKGLRNRALSSFEIAVAREKEQPEFLNNYGFLLYRNGEYEKATKYLKRAAKADPNNPRIWNNLALAQCEREHFDDAYKSFVRAVGEYRGHFNIAMQLEQKGRNTQAIKHLEKASAINPNSTEVLVRLISLYQSTGRYEQAQGARTSLLTLRALANTPAQ